MKLLAAGRQADVFDVGNGRVLRRYRTATTALGEAEVMRHVREYGFPVPEVLDATPADLILERIEGPTMLADLGPRPWRVARHARLLADLHRRLHAIAPPPGLRMLFGEPESLLHLDLHPGNVHLTPNGPVVIDWPAAAAGPAEADVAQTWILVATSDASAFERAARLPFIRAFLGCFDRGAIAGILPAVAERRLADENVRDSERTRIRRLAGLTS